MPNDDTQQGRSAVVGEHGMEMASPEFMWSVRKVPRLETLRAAIAWRKRVNLDA